MHRHRRAEARVVKWHRRVVQGHCDATALLRRRAFVVRLFCFAEVLRCRGTVVPRHSRAKATMVRGRLITTVPLRGMASVLRHGRTAAPQGLRTPQPDHKAVLQRQSANTQQRRGTKMGPSRYRRQATWTTTHATFGQNPPSWLRERGTLCRVGTECQKASHLQASERTRGGNPAMGTLPYPYLPYTSGCLCQALFIRRGGEGGRAVLSALRPTHPKKILTQNLAEGKSNSIQRPLCGPPRPPPRYISTPS